MAPCRWLPVMPDTKIAASPAWQMQLLMSTAKGTPQLCCLCRLLCVQHVEENKKPVLYLVSTSYPCMRVFQMHT